MEKIKNGIVFSNDIGRILKGNNALNFNYEKLGLKIPNSTFIKSLRENFSLCTNRIFNNVTIISEEEMLKRMDNMVDRYFGDLPIISLDKVYSYCDEKNIMFLDCTRMSGDDELVSRNDINNKSSVKNQINQISRNLKNNQIILLDDVVFSGNVLRKIINEFAKNNVEVVGIVSGICTNDSYNYFNKNLKYGVSSGYLLGEGVIDQICERDFYFGIAQSGISIRKNNEIYKAPYFLPYGDPCQRASIPKEYEESFSRECIERSIQLWSEIEKNSNKKIFINDLPEKINNVNENEEVTKVLKRSIKWESYK